MMSAMVPTIIGLNEATKGARESEDKRKENEKKTRFHLVATCDIDADSESRRQEVHNANVFLGSDKKVRKALLVEDRTTEQLPANSAHEVIYN